jgi:ribokinase
VSARVAVVGHVEWVDFMPVARLPRPGELTHSERAFSRPAGGGGVACGVLAELGAETELFCALGSGEHAEATRAQLRAQGVRVHDAPREQPMRRAITLLEPGGDRLIVTIGERLEPAGADPLPWERLDATDAVYFTAGDAGALAHARRARVLVATPRAGAVLRSGPMLDALVYSADDADERAWAEQAASRTRLRFATEGDRGGHFTGEACGRWEAAAPPGPVHDSYGCGDAFAAVLACALGSGEPLQRAITQAAGWGARMLVRTGAP